MRKEWNLGKARTWQVWESKQDTLVVVGEGPHNQVAMIFNFADYAVRPQLPEWPGVWRTRIRSADRTWNGLADPLPKEVRFSKPFALELHPHSFFAFERKLSDHHATIF